MFFIHDDEAKVADRRKDRGPRSQHHLRFTAADLPPRFVPHSFRQPAVKDGHLISESRQELRLHSRRQSDFRHQHQGRAAALQTARDQPQVDFSLATRRNPMQ